MAEQGARPKVPKVRQRILRAARAFTTPLMPDDYLEMINPLWSTREPRGRVEAVVAETPDCVTLWLRPSRSWFARSILTCGMNVSRPLAVETGHACRNIFGQNVQ